MNFSEKFSYLFILSLVALTVLTMPLIAGCISVSKAGDTDAVDLPGGVQGPDGGGAVSAAAVQRETKSTVMPAEAILTVQSDRIVLKNPPTLEANTSHMLGTLFQEKRLILQSNYAYIVDVAAPPLVIRFKATPASTDPRESYFVVTVRDEKSREIIVKDGYGRIYSGNKEQEIIIYGAGTYHINIEASQIDVEFKILTADAPLEELPLVFEEDAFEFWEYF
ncbi:MAG TPA: hypothetical protein ENN52_04870 [Methanofollis liminatans]|uniref:Uncharacterized protein n=1 Tax=Methanofollis liminatans TaxID=2201 RepID=A0A831LQL3_9EURY|nr:hypothetical protein [Methanofollis liminatans]